MNSAQRKIFNKKINKVADRFAEPIETVIKNYDSNEDVITVADLKYILEEIKD